jgi:subtilase family serine protease
MLAQSYFRYRSLVFESLESRSMMSANSSGIDLTQIHAHPNALKGPYSPLFSGWVFTPADVRKAYGFDQTIFNNPFFGVLPGSGAGQTIAIVDAFNVPTVRSDLQFFDRNFGLPDPPNLRIVQMQPPTPMNPNFPPIPGTWGIETALDVQWAHAMAPLANILLVEAASDSLNDLFAADTFAASQPGVVVVSNSFGLPNTEFAGENNFDSIIFNQPAGHTPITWVFSAGDTGAPAGFPGTSANVLTVGGTSLQVDPNGNWFRELSWSQDSSGGGGGGGQSAFEGLPSYQKGLPLIRRGTPDVAYNGNPSTGVWVYDTFDVGFTNLFNWVQIGGTSAGAPQWSGLIAVADQGRALLGKAALGNAQSAVYKIPRTDFHDITFGTNGQNVANPGYDLVTGLGSPIANLVIRDLVAFNGSTAFTVAPLPPTPITFPISSVRARFFGTGPAVQSPVKAPETNTQEIDSAEGMRMVPTDASQPIEPPSVARLDVLMDSLPLPNGRHGKRVWDTLDASNIDSFFAALRQ